MRMRLTLDLESGKSWKLKSRSAWVLAVLAALAYTGLVFGSGYAAGRAGCEAPVAPAATTSSAATSAPSRVDAPTTLPPTIPSQSTAAPPTRGLQCK